MTRPPIILLAGPTGSGKTAAALALARRLGAEIVGADSMQIYRDLPVLTAQPTADEQALVAHHLVGTVDGAEAWSVGRWLEAATAALDDLAARDKAAIVVGGTGLYFRALTHGLAEMPSVPLPARDAAEAEYDAVGEAGVREALATLDPAAAARIAVNDRQRLVRALAVARHTGRALSDWQSDTTPVLAEGSWRGLVLEPPREALYARCDARLLAMVEHGALEEVAALLARGLDPELPVMKAVGVRELAAHVGGGTNLAKALAMAQQATRNYAKRQLTWFRNQTRGWTRFDDAERVARSTL